MSVPGSDEQDARDMSRLVEGHETALNDLMARHAEALFHYLVRSLRDEEDAADLAQETFVRIFQNRAKFDPRRKFTTWLFSIAGNLVRDRYRWRARHPKISLEAASGPNETGWQDRLPAVEPAPDQCLQTAERAAAVRRAVASLPEELRQPLILSVYQELPQAEIGAILNCSTKAVEMRLYRARQQLRLNLAAGFPAT